MDQPNTPAANCGSNIPQAGAQQQQQQQQRPQESGEAREAIRVRNDTTEKWTRLFASVDSSLPFPRIDLQTLRKVHGQQQVTFSEQEHSHPGVHGGGCIGTIELRCQSNSSPAGFRGSFCIVRAEEEEGRGVVLTRSLKANHAGQVSIFPIGNKGDLSPKDLKRQKQAAKERAKQREKENSRKKDEDRSEKDKEIRGESWTTQQSTS